MNQNDDVQALLPLSAAQFHILLALADAERHGYAIMSEVRERTSGQVNIGPGTLYGNLKKMIKAGWIEEIAPPPTQPSDERQRRVYKLTDFGRRVGSAEAERLAALVNDARQKQLLPEVRHA